MRQKRAHAFLVGVLVASLAANLLLTLAARDYYIRSKVLPTEPTFEHAYRDQNATVHASSSRPLAIVFGDSRVKGWNPLPKITGHTVLNRGIDGETTAQMTHRFKTDVLDLKPAVVILQAGINDLVAAGLEPQREKAIFDAVIANLTSMTHNANASGIRVVLLTIIPPASPSLVRRLVWSHRIESLVRTANHELIALHAPPRVMVIDTPSLLQTSDGRWQPDVTADTLHLTSTGYAALNVAVHSLLSRD